MSTDTHVWNDRLNSKIAAARMTLHAAVERLEPLKRKDGDWFGAKRAVETSESDLNEAIDEAIDEEPEGSWSSEATARIASVRKDLRDRNAKFAVLDRKKRSLESHISKLTERVVKLTGDALQLDIAVESDVELADIASDKNAIEALAEFGISTANQYVTARRGRINEALPLRGDVFTQAVKVLDQAVYQFLVHDNRPEDWPVKAPAGEQLYLMQMPKKSAPSKADAAGQTFASLVKSKVLRNDLGGVARSLAKAGIETPRVLFANMRDDLVRNLQPSIVGTVSDETKFRDLVAGLLGIDGLIRDELIRECLSDITSKAGIEVIAGLAKPLPALHDLLVTIREKSFDDPKPASKKKPATRKKTTKKKASKRATRKKRS